ncbi:hypothetical protein [Pandoraea iniqua]|uniref:hypothetical protein n=1 Tax=Pandoraea iniqua TaxID=2508288 RepID=UPI001240BDB7|nr:hypothetical protein [Pandoraea iniqua]
MSKLDATLERPATAMQRSGPKMSGRSAAVSSSGLLADVDAPVCEQAVNGALNPDDLTVQGASFIVKAYAGMAVGDYLLLRFDVAGPNEVTVDFDVTTNFVGQDITIRIPKNKILPALDTEVDVDYVVERAAGGDNLESDILSLYIGVRDDAGLTAPSVDEADGDHLDPEYIEYGIRVRIPVYDGMAIGDEIVLHWAALDDAGYYTDRITVRAVREVTFPILTENLAPFLDKRVPVSYEVLRDGATYPSDVFDLRIGEVADEGLLAIPAVVEATGNVLNPDLVTGGATAHIGPYEGNQAGDYVHVVWGGGPPTGFESYIDITERYLTEPYPVRIPFDKISPFIDRSVALYYEKELPDGTWQLSQTLTLDVKRETVQAGPPAVPLSSDGKLDPRDIDPAYGAEVAVPPYPGMRQGDTVVMIWKGEGGGDFESPPYIVKSTDVGNAVSFYVPYLSVMASLDKGVDVHYEVTRAGTVIIVSTALELSIRQSDPPAAILLEAVGDSVNPDDCLDGAHVQLPAGAKFRAGDKVSFRWHGLSGAGTFTKTITVADAEAGGPLEVVVPHATVAANVNGTVSLEYTISRANGAEDETAPPAILDVVAVPGSGELLVLGARGSDNVCFGYGKPQYVSTFQKSSRQGLNAQWRYDDEVDWTLAHSFRDVRPWMPLRVRSADDTLTLNPANITGSGVQESALGYAAFVAHLNKGNVVGWGSAAHGATVPSTIVTYDDVIETSSTEGAFAVRRSNGRIAVWGNTAQGGALPADFTVTDAVRIVGNTNAFALLRANGQVKAWGRGNTGVTIPPEIEALTNIISLHAAGTAFAARLASGAAVAWGVVASGGSMPAEIGALTDIVDIRGCRGGFSALRANKHVVAWGSTPYGGVVPGAIAARSDIMELASATIYAFAVRTESHEVLAWGDADFGGTVPADIAALSDVEEVVATQSAFCARRANGAVVAWGNAAQGGTVPQEVAVLNNVVQVARTWGAFAALCSDGTVVAWGMPAIGGSTAAVAPQLVNVRAIYSNTEAFAAVLADGGVVTWGVAAAGGDSTAVKPIVDSGLTYEATSAVRGRALTALALQMR